MSSVIWSIFCIVLFNFMLFWALGSDEDANSWPLAVAMVCFAPRAPRRSSMQRSHRRKQELSSAAEETGLGAAPRETFQRFRPHCKNVAHQKIRLLSDDRNCMKSLV